MNRIPRTDLPPEVREDADLIKDGVMDELEALEAKAYEAEAQGEAEDIEMSEGEDVYR